MCNLQARDHRFKSMAELNLCCGVVSLDKALDRLAYSLDPGENRYLVSDSDSSYEQCVASTIIGSGDCMLPREMKVFSE